MKKRVFLNTVIAGGIIVAAGLPTYAEVPFDGPASGPIASGGSQLLFPRTI